MAGIFDNVIDLSPVKTTWKIKVKIIRLWISVGDIESIEMVLLDSNGDMIHATVNEDVIPIFESFFEEDDSKIFINFSLSQSCGSYRLTKHPLKNWFQATTRVRFCDDLPYKIDGFTPPITDCNFLCCARYMDILRGLSHPKFCVDLGGAMVEVGVIEDIQEIQGNKIFANNQIRIRLAQIRCVVYGSVAEKLYQHRIASNVNVLICVLKLWRIERANGRFRHLTTVEGCSDILFNSEISQIKYYKSMIPFRGF
ncbi:hypothetical protein HID58_059775 [Brassica napus]|uniref:Replication protein A 70 kDa DNA-binding subunit B/D first OB fold domain-containing protein n=1 Tax=Brassica napus TaxID=3708 RepID=A0ABQ7ZTU9_BRANA|nr:hypothetical protein HID58_059775 [Brassica napus]